MYQKLLDELDVLIERCLSFQSGRWDMAYEAGLLAEDEYSKLMEIQYAIYGVLPCELEVGEPS